MKKWLPSFLLLSSICYAQLPATADPGFMAYSVWGSYYTQVDNMALQPDGKVLIVTANSEPSWVRKLERLNSDGTVDSTFSIQNIDGNNNFVSPLIVLPDGDILLGDALTVDGVLKGMVRLNADGSVDSGFNYPIVLGTTNIMDLVLQPDGKILVAGDFSQAIVRLNPDGSIDNSFIDISSYNLGVWDLILQPDGKILASGDFTYYDGASFISRDMIRLNSDGTVDATFSSAAADGPMVTMALQPDGKVIVGGSFETIGTTTRRGVARLNANGSLDTSFFAFSLYSGTNVNSVLVRPNGNILIAGGTSLISMLLPNGSPDYSFYPSANDSFNGIYMDSGSPLFAVTKVLQQPDGKILHCGDYGRCCVAYNSRNICRLLGTDYYRVNGGTKLDMQNDGCDTSDSGFPFLRYKLVNGTNESYYYTGDGGDHNVFIKNGTSVITPELFNPSWFTISPPSITVTMPSTSNYYNQNFCVTPVGTHHDLEISVVPLRRAVPGFEGEYKIMIRNNGNQTETGIVSFNYDEAVCDFVDSSPAVTGALSGQAVWGFGPLQPFSGSEFEVRLHFNSPADTPPLQENDVLNFTATVSGINDEVPSNNTATLQQVLVNSFDPNDKTCLEGISIAPEQVGDFVHYQIRFENTGTWPAQNITVTDIIDTSKFDIATLSPMGGSHSYTTRVIAGNKAEFIFENINLGFADGDNDGWLLFKIRTKATLQEADIFENTANIYFDYNTAITTNTASTIVQSVLHTASYKNASVSLSPIPADSRLMIQNPGQVKITSIAVYNMLGQSVLESAYTDSTEGIDVSALSAGTYFLYMYTTEGRMMKKFMKR